MHLVGPVPGTWLLYAWWSDATNLYVTGGCGSVAVGARSADRLLV
jgi:hypothetical protein